MSKARRIVAFGVALFSAALLFASVPSPAHGQDKKPDDPPKIEPKPRGQLYPNWTQLGLTKEQITEIYKIQTEHRAKIDQLEEQIAKLKKEEKAKAETVLTPAQKARLKEILSGEKPEPPKDKPTPPKDKPEPPKDKVKDAPPAKDK